MTNLEFVAKLKEITENYKTSYMLGCWGFLTNDSNISYSVGRKGLNNNRFKAGAESIKNDGWMFDCVCLIKAVLWGFEADKDKPRGGGAKYGSNGVPDIGADQMINVCKGVSTDFSGIEVGEAVWVKGHIGVYVGDGKVVECTPKWSVAPDGVKYSNLGNLGYASGRSRTWTKHGKLPYIEYVKVEKDEVNGMTKEELKAFIEETVKQMGVGQPVSTWAEGQVKEAIELGITDGSNPQRLATRQEVMIMAKRAAEINKG